MKAETFAPCPKCGGVVARRAGLWACHDGCGWPDGAGKIATMEREAANLAALARQAHTAYLEAQERHRIMQLALAELRNKQTEEGS